MPSLGNVGASALVKSAGSLSSQIADYQDKMAALQWNSSAQTDADYTTYQNYLNGRIGTLSTTGSLSSSSKALTLTSTLQSANRSYVSNSIQRASIDILEGNASPVDKQNAIVDFYQQAVANGDENLAQNLRGQYDSLNQQIQYQAQTAATAQASLDKANNAAIAAGYSDAASMYEGVLKSIGSVISAGGQGNLTKDLKDFVSNNADTFKALGVTLPKGSAATNGALIAGLMTAQAAANYKAAQATAITDPIASSNYQQQAVNVLNNTTTFSVAGTAMTLQDATYYAQNPNAYFQATTGTDVEGNPIYGLKQAAVLGYQYDQNGNIQPIHGPNDQSTYDALSGDDQKNMVKDLQNAGFTVKVVNGQVEATQSTDGKNNFFSNAISNYGISKQTQFIVQKTGTGYQFEPVNDSNTTPHLLTLSKDNTGKFGLYEQNFDTATKSQSYNLIGQFDGFNAVQNSVTQSADRAASLAGALAKTFTGGTTLSPAYINQSIPQLAKQYFNGNTDLATAAVNSYVQPLQYKAANPQSVQAKGVVPAAAPVQSIAQNTAQILGVPLIGPNVQKQAPTKVPATTAPKTTTPAAPAPVKAATPNIAGSGLIKIPNSNLGGL